MRKHELDPSVSSSLQQLDPTGSAVEPHADLAYARLGARRLRHIVLPQCDLSGINDQTPYFETRLQPRRQQTRARLTRD